MSAGVLGYLALGLCCAGAMGALAADAFDRRGLGVALVLAGTWSAAVSAAAIPLARAGTGSIMIGGGGVAAVVFALAGLAVLSAARRFAEEGNGGQQAALLGFMAAATAVISGTRDLAVLFIAVEGSALAAYALVASERSRKSEEAAVKYFVQGAVTASAFVLAIALLVGMYGGKTGYGDLGAAVSRNGGGAAALAMMLLIAVFAFKLAGFPFHSWAPDVYECAPAPVAAFMAGAPKAAAVVAATVLLKRTVFASMASEAQWSVMLLAAGSVVYGNLAALKQRSYTRMLGYSGIAQAGYLLIGLAVMGHADAFSVALMGVTYAAAAAGAFVAADAVRAVRPSWDGTIAALAGLGREKPWLGAAMTACLLSLTGIPLTAGFWGKLYVFWDAVDHRVSWLALLGALGSVVSFGYYGAVVRALFIDDAPVADGAGASGSSGRRPARGPVAVAVACAAVVVGLGVGPLAVGLDAIKSFLGT